jgi:hypothetical protein
VVPEGHPEARADGRVELLHVGRLAEVPDRTGGSYDEDSDGLEEGVGPQGRKDEVVKVTKAGRGVGLDAGEDVSAVDDELGSSDEGDHRVEAEDPEGKDSGAHDERDQHHLTGRGDELASYPAESHSQPDPSTAADDHEDDQAEESQTDPPENVVVGEGGKVGDTDAKVADELWLAYGTSVVEEKNCRSRQEQDHQQERHPDKAPSEALEEGHEEDRKDYRQY